MKPGNLVYFSNKYLPYDYAQLQGQYGLLLERVDIPTSNNDQFVKGLIAQQLVTVQPMTVPSGLLFYLDYSYGSGSKDEENK